MNFTIKGNLRGLLCSDCELPVTGTSVKIYRPAPDSRETLLAVADAKQTFHQLTADELKAKEKLFIAEGKLQDNGNFEVDLGQRSGYDGGALEIDWYCGNSPIKIGPGPKKEVSLQFHITTFQPMWQGNKGDTQYAYFEYRIDPKWFCRILSLFDIWVVCGIVTDCETRKPISGVRVFAFDVDLIQDDSLGNAYTDGNGKFTIVYPGDNFRKTLLSPWLNVEWPAGPDYYFRIESSSGAVLLAEDRTRGRQADRHNAHNCFCVKLCVKNGPTDTSWPWFTEVGNFSITSDIDASGKTLMAKFGAGGAGYGFFGSVKLGGYATKRVPTAPGSPLYYRFLYSLDNVNFTKITAAQMEPNIALKVATRQITWHGGVAFQDVVIDINQPASAPDSIPADNYPLPIADHVLHPDVDGWVRVDQPALDDGFYGSLFYLNTNAILPGGDASVGQTAATAVSAGDQKNGKMLYIQFQTTDDPANPASPNLQTQALVAQIYVNNWNEVSLVKLEELYAGGGSGCTPVKTQAHIDYTVDHELIGNWNLSISSNATGSIGGLPSGNVPRGAAAQLNLATAAGITPAFATWPSCAYALSLNTIRKLTTGEYNDDWTPNVVLFCK